MKIYNTLTRKKEEFKPLISGKVSMYVCGPTVYNYIHIGNARSAVSFDTIRRYLEYRGFEVNYVSNFTDVDDKMINAAKEQGISVSELAKRFINAYLEDTRALNIKPANKYPRATEEIDEIISFIKKLIAQGYAYEKAGSVYYRTKKFKDYGQLSGQDIASLEVGASQHVTKQEQEDKDDPLDFALWKKQKTSSEIAWTSPWGKGRPGWHIECSVMAIKYLSETIDIHGGGQDLEFPHHENEIAQSQALTGKKFANYWLHNGLVTVGQEQEKMSKSQHNFVTVHELLKTVPAVVLRFFLASVHYRKQINYSKENLQQARNILNRFKNTLERLNYRLSDQTTSLHSEKLCQAGQQAQINFVSAMDDDFNVQNALKAVYDLLPVINDNLNLPQSDKENLRHLKQSLKTWLGIFGVDFEKLLFNQENAASEKINLLITQRNQARENKDWEKSDRLRDELKTLGVSLKDTPQGTRWTYDKG